MRSELLQEQAVNRGGIYLECDSWKRDMQFLKAIATAVGAPIARTRSDVIDKINASLVSNPRPLFLDRIDLPKPGMVEYLQMIHERAKVLIVMAGDPAKLVQLINDPRSDRSFWNRGRIPKIEDAVSAVNLKASPEGEGTSVIGRVGLDRAE